MARARPLLIASVAALCLAVSAGTAAAKSLPTIYSTVRGHHHDTVFTPVFSVRPHVIDLFSYLGGTLRLTWTRWNDARAVGHGTSEPGVAVQPGQQQPIYAVNVRASRVVAGHFTRLKVTLHYSPTDVVTEHLHLTQAQGQFTWVG